MAIIVDIDGTLVRKGVIPNPQIVDLCNNSTDVLLVTGREEKERANTEAMLHGIRVKYTHLAMNNIGPKPQSQLASKELNARDLMKRYHVTEAIDDDPAARAVYQSLGIPNVTGP